MFLTRRAIKKVLQLPASLVRNKRSLATGNISISIHACRPGKAAGSGQRYLHTGCGTRLHGFKPAVLLDPSAVTSITIKCAAQPVSEKGSRKGTTGHDCI